MVKFVYLRSTKKYLKRQLIKNKMSRRGENPYEFNPPSEMPEGFGTEIVDLNAQTFFMKHQGIPRTFAGQLMYVGPIVNQLSEDIEWYMNTFNDLQNSMKMFPDIMSECSIRPAFQSSHLLKF